MSNYLQKRKRLMRLPPVGEESWFRQIGRLRHAADRMAWTTE